VVLPSGSIDDRSSLIVVVLVDLHCPVYILSGTNGGLHAQLSTQATITGTVTDPTGAVVSGATVTLTDDATKVSTVTKTNSDGVYIVPDLA
jgi:hypothetical protein